MAKQIHALLVGINDYAPAVGRLYGCINDVDEFHDYLTDSFDPNALRIEILKDADATRQNIIDQFRSHLSKATADDVVVFQYCGHGARWKSAKPFEEFYPDGKDEGLVCYDSREDGKFDLADKELAVLLAEVASKGPHIAVILDSCHSGSATRSADDFTQSRARQTHEVHEERQLETYLDGHYATLLKNGASLEIPASRHILLAACERFQKAYETPMGSGMFTSSLMHVLSKAGADISYADLFTRCRAAIRKRADTQDPQFETYSGFNAYNGFLGGLTRHNARRFSVYFENNAWQVDCGALHGLPSDPDKNAEMAVYADSDRSRLVAHAATIQVGAQKSELEFLDFDADTSTNYESEITSLPVPPLLVRLQGEAEGTESFQKYLAESQDHSFGFALLTDAEGGADYTLTAENGRYLLNLSETGKLIQGAEGYTKDSADYMFGILKRVADWERAAKLQNHSTRMNPADVSFKYREFVPDDVAYEHSGSEITLDMTAERGQSQDSTVEGEFKADNRTDQPLHMMLVQFTDDFGITVVYNEPIKQTEELFTLMPMGQATVNFFLDEDEGNEQTHIFKLIVSTEKVDDFLIGQQPLTLGEISSTCGKDRGSSYGSPRKKLAHKNEWFCKDITFRLIRQSNRLSDGGASLAGGKIKIKGPASLQAGTSLSAAKTGTRGVGAGPDIYRAMERQGLEMLNFSGTRGDNENVLEITDIQNSEDLKEIPLDIELGVDLDEGEFILPLTFDGEHILLTGDPSQDEAGRTHISINHIPDIPDNRRSLGKALKLYFFKTALSRDNVNELCWVEYGGDGAVDRHPEGVAEKVAAAKSVLLLIHGIIGDTQGIAEGLRKPGINEKFDLVLTFDYENLSTPIQDTAIDLKTKLRDVGLHQNDDLRLTLLVHSMGGLVSRWFIEREGGNKVVDHLVMCGTPNVGSPFGKINGARNLSQALTAVAINSCPVFAPFGGALLYALNRSQKLTRCLEQMNPSDEFIKTLNASDDPGIRYTIVAGDIRGYREESDDLIPRLLAKVGDGTLFDNLYEDAGHDIAVSDDSILGVSETRSPAPVKHSVAGHHLNYFVNDASLQMLASVEW